MVSIHVSWMSRVHDLFWYNYMRCTVCGKFVRLFFRDVCAFLYFLNPIILNHYSSLAYWLFPLDLRERETASLAVCSRCLSETHKDLHDRYMYLCSPVAFHDPILFSLTHPYLDKICIDNNQISQMSFKWLLSIIWIYASAFEFVLEVTFCQIRQKG